MGYRNYLILLEKETVSSISDLSIEELQERFGDQDSFCIHNVFEQTLYNLGEISDIDSKRLYAKGKPLFTSKEVMEDLEDYKPYIVGREGLLEVIEIYKEKVISHFKDLLVDNKEDYFEEGNRTSSQKMEWYIKSMLKDWEHFPPINLHENTDAISNSYKYEYIIFELVRKYKTVDFNKNTLILYGY